MTHFKVGPHNRVINFNRRKILIPLILDDQRDIGNRLWIEDSWEKSVADIFTNELREELLALHNHLKKFKEEYLSMVIEKSRKKRIEDYKLINESGIRSFKGEKHTFFNDWEQNCKIFNGIKDSNSETGHMIRLRGMDGFEKNVQANMDVAIAGVVDLVFSYQLLKIKPKMPLIILAPLKNEIDLILWDEAICFLMGPEMAVNVPIYFEKIISDVKNREFVFRPG